jgi:hypothetical protein
MDALSGLKRIASCLFPRFVSCFLLFADLFSSPEGGLNLRTPAGPGTGICWMFDTVIEVHTEVTI